MSIHVNLVKRVFISPRRKGTHTHTRVFDKGTNNRHISHTGKDRKKMGGVQTKMEWVITHWEEFSQDFDK